MATPLTNEQIEMVTRAYRKMGFISNSDNGYMEAIFTRHAQGEDFDKCIDEESADRDKYRNNYLSK